jgi:hypothetical protein
LCVRQQTELSKRVFSASWTIEFPPSNSGVVHVVHRVAAERLRLDFPCERIGLA